MKNRYPVYDYYSVICGNIVITSETWHKTIIVFIFLTMEIAWNEPVFHLAISNMAQHHVAFCERHVALHVRHVALIELLLRHS